MAPRSEAYVRFGPEELGAFSPQLVDGIAAASGIGRIRPAPTTWCSWCQYFTAVTEVDTEENLVAICDRDLPVDVIQLDDGYQRELGAGDDSLEHYGARTGRVEHDQISAMRFAGEHRRDLSLSRSAHRGRSQHRAGFAQRSVGDVRAAPSRSRC